MPKLTAIALKTLPSGKHEDGDGLRVVIYRPGQGKWVYRYTLHGRRIELGLGAFPVVSLREARIAAGRARALVASGTCPKRLREEERKAAQAARLTFEEAMYSAYESLKTSLKGGGTAGRWLSPLKVHVVPKLGNTPVAQITQHHIRDTLSPIWRTKPDAARKALNRSRKVLRHAAALGLNVDLNATELAKELLGDQGHRSQNIPSMAWQDVPGFYTSMHEGTVTELALRLMILTAARSANVRSAHVDQFEGATWTIPADSMKGRVGKTADFRIPLSDEALNVVAQARRLGRDGFLFPGQRRGVISDMTMAKYMSRAGLTARPHGFRSSLRDWLAECTDAPHEVAETMLAHTPGSAVVRAYRRTDFFDQRRFFLERWAEHCTLTTNTSHL